MLGIVLVGLLVKVTGKKKTICDVVVTVLNQYKDLAMTVSVVVASVFS